MSAVASSSTCHQARRGSSPAGTGGSGGTEGPGSRAESGCSRPGALPSQVRIAVAMPIGFAVPQIVEGKGEKEPVRGPARAAARYGEVAGEGAGIVVEQVDGGGCAEASRKNAAATASRGAEGQHQDRETGRRS